MTRCLPNFRDRRRSKHCGFTIVELLVTMGIISVLVALLLPAVLGMRESARRTQCQNNLRQVALGLHNFHSLHGQFPRNGWGFAWVAEPGRAAGISQPGGWIYQLLPQIEQSPLWAIGAAVEGDARRAALIELSQASVPTLKCPSRPCEQKGPPSHVFQYRNMSTVTVVSRTDYAINEGDFITGTPGGPPNLLAGDDLNYPWTDVSAATGVSWLRRAAKFQDITDGSSNVYLVGEKYVSTQGYAAAKDPGYDQTMFSGVDLDLARWSTEPPISDRVSLAERRFGSAHSAGCFMAFCDGAVRIVSYEVNADLHRWLGNRSDGRVLGLNGGE